MYIINVDLEVVRKLNTHVLEHCKSVANVDV